MENINETQVVDQTVLAEDVSSKIKYELPTRFLVKPLDPVMVKKEFDKPIAKNEPVKDENGVEAVDYEEVETETKEVESDYRRGVVLKVPYSYQQQMADDKYPSMPINVGDIIVYRANQGVWFDQLKDSQFVESYSIYAVER